MKPKKEDIPEPIEEDLSEHKEQDFPEDDEILKEIDRLQAIREG
jgi:hypothetical protein